MKRSQPAWKDGIYIYTFRATDIEIVYTSNTNYTLDTVYMKTDDILVGTSAIDLKLIAPNMLIPTLQTTSIFVGTNPTSQPIEPKTCTCGSSATRDPGHWADCALKS